MDTLKNKSYNSFDYTCRYSNIPFYYNTKDEKYIYGIGQQLSKDTQYVAHKTKDTDTLDYLALKYYGNPTLYWVIAYFNDITDAYIDLVDFYPIIKVPALSSIEFKDPR